MVYSWVSEDIDDDGGEDGDENDMNINYSNRWIEIH